MSKKKSLCGIFFQHDGAFDFYDGKLLLTQLFDELRLSVVWKKTDNKKFPWLHQYQTADLMHENTCIGIAGIVEQSIVNQLTESGGVIFLFELDGDYLTDHK